MPDLSLTTFIFIRTAYACLMLATGILTLSHARRFFLSSTYHGYADPGALRDRILTPAGLVLLLAAWGGALASLALGYAPLFMAASNWILCRYFFIASRWSTLHRGAGAPGFLAYWLGTALLALEFSRAYAPAAWSFIILAIQVDFAGIFFVAGLSKLLSGYRTGHGMEYGFANPEWCYFWRWYQSRPSVSPAFALFNQLAWSTEMLAGILMVIPTTRPLGAILIAAAFLFLMTHIRLGFLSEMVILGCFFFIPGGSRLDDFLAPWIDAPSLSQIPTVTMLDHGVATAVLLYIGLLVPVYAGLLVNQYRKQRLSGLWQRLLERYTNAFGIILWRVFTPDVTRFYGEVYLIRGGPRDRIHVTRWGTVQCPRYCHVVEAITVTCILTSAIYYTSRPEFFRERAQRYAQSVTRERDDLVEIEMWEIMKDGGRFAPRRIASILVSPNENRIIAEQLPQIRPMASHEAAGPGTYAPRIELS